MRRALAMVIVRIAAILLPVRLRDWSRAMVAELASIERPGAALAFALGCLGAALRQARPVRSLGQVRSLAILCAIAAVGLGWAYMTAAGAPFSYLVLNAAALAIGLLAIGILRDAGRIWRAADGGILLALGAIVLLTSLFGLSANGVTRWFAVGGVMLQPALILVPVIALGFARAPGKLPLLAILITALGLALQPDRAMAGALAAGMAALALYRPGPTVLTALAAALAAFVATMVQADASPAMPFVDQILYSSFGVHPLAGLAVLAGAALMLIPAIAGMLRNPDNRPLHLVFGMVWFGVIIAAALGNYPTPLVGYGGSAILGYLLGLLALPPNRSVPIATPFREPGQPAPAAAGPDLRAALTLAG